jgi:hypothetical protein
MLLGWTRRWHIHADPSLRPFDLKMNVIVVARRPAGHGPTHPNLRISADPKLMAAPIFETR